MFRTESHVSNDNEVYKRFYYQCEIQIMNGMKRLLREIDYTDVAFNKKLISTFYKEIQTLNE